MSSSQLPAAPGPAEAARLVRTARRALAPALEARHVRSCHTCSLEPVELLELEQLLVQWFPVSKLAELYGPSEGSIRRHAAFYQLDTARLRHLSHGYARVIEQGISSGTAGPAHALAGLKQLDELHAPAPAPIAPGETEETLTWEQRVRMKRTSSPAGAPAPPAQLAEPVEPRQLEPQSGAGVPAGPLEVAAPEASDPPAQLEQDVGLVVPDV